MSAAGYLAASVPLRLASSGSVVALPILAVTDFDDVALGGLLVAASMGPSVLAAPLAGVAMDRSRHPRRLVLVSALLTAVAFGLCAAAGPVPIPLVLIALAIAGCTVPFFMGGLSSFAAEEIAVERRAYAFDVLAYTIGAVAGPAVVAVAIAAGSARVAMLALTGIAVIGAVGILGTRMPARPTPDEHPLRTIAAGIRHIVAHRPLSVATLSGSLSQVGVGALPIVAVSLALDRTGSPDAGAWIVTAFAVGSLVGGVVGAARQWTDLHPVLIMGGGFAVIGALTVIAAIDLGIAWTVLVIGISGFFNAPSSAVIFLIRRQQSTLRVRSQVFTIGAGLRASAAAAGAAVAGIVAGLDAGVLLALIGVVWLASALVLLAYPRGAQPLAET